MTRFLNNELHLHLYGCLTPEDLFQLGRDHYRQKVDALKWYANEYKASNGSKPDWERYWAASSGPELIAKDFLATEPMTFSQFQSRFNLMIALLPTIDYGTTVLKHVVPAQAHQGITYGEYRIFVPPTLSPDQLARYYLQLGETTEQLNSEFQGAHSARIALSMSRSPAIFSRQYSVLKQMQQSNSSVASTITAVDFCGVEEGFPPELQQQACQQILADNAAQPQHALAILYHVGESFDQMSVFAAMRWIVSAATMGAHRLGHAIAAGIDIEGNARFSDGVAFFEPRCEAKALMAFIEGESLLGTKEDAPAANHVLALYQQALVEDEDPISFTWTKDLRSAATSLQSSVLHFLKQKQTVIESCPTSNRIIGRIANNEELPVFRFAEEDLNFLISSDDPGIFATTLQQEEELCRNRHGETLGLDTMQLQRAGVRNLHLRAGLVAGRSSW